MYDFTSFKEEIEKIKEWLRSEYSALHSGRVTPNLLDKIFVDSYGSKTLISHVASISVEDARTLRISPWDHAQVQPIEKALISASLGASVLVDDSGVRLAFPELTTESKGALVKIIKSRLEDARISLKTEREKVWENIQAQQKSGELTEDDKFKLKEDLQKLIDDANLSFEEIGRKKETEIMS